MPISFLYVILSNFVIINRNDWQLIEMTDEVNHIEGKWHKIKPRGRYSSLFQGYTKGEVFVICLKFN